MTVVIFVLSLFLINTNVYAIQAEGAGDGMGITLANVSFSDGDVRTMMERN